MHPLNTTAGVPVSFSTNKKAKYGSSKPTSHLKSAPTPTATSPFTPSPQVPRLSAYFSKHQLGGNLAEAAAAARQKVDLGVDEEMSSPERSEQNSPLEPNGRAGKTTIPGRPLSRKGHRQPQQRPRPSPLAPAPLSGLLKSEYSEVPESPQYQGPNLSPHTADSNPGLVSDHEDDDHGSASEEEAPHTEIRRPFNVGPICSDNVEIAVTEDDEVDRSGVIIRRNSIFADDERSLRAAGSPSRKLGVSKRSN